MNITEEEARTKRCQESFPAAEALSQHGTSEHAPIVTQSVVYPYGPNGPAMSSGNYTGFARHTAPTHCIASACMAWRWEFGNDRAFRGKDANKGYCGKAGKP